MTKIESSYRVGSRCLCVEIKEIEAKTITRIRLHNRIYLLLLTQANAAMFCPPSAVMGLITFSLQVTTDV